MKKTIYHIIAGKIWFANNVNLDRHLQNHVWALGEASGDYGEGYDGQEGHRERSVRGYWEVGYDCWGEVQKLQEELQGKIPLCRKDETSDCVLGGQGYWEEVKRNLHYTWNGEVHAGQGEVDASQEEACARQGEDLDEKALNS